MTPPSSNRHDVRLENVIKQFGGLTVVDNISLTVKGGEFFSLLGPSGCGKSTTLSMIGGFENPTSGAIYLDGEDVSRQQPYKRDVNTVFQSYALFPHLDIFENVAFGLRRKGLPKAEIESRVKEMLDLVDLTKFTRRKPGQISGGQAQRVALARALVNRPKLLLLDEPLGALDLKLRKQMQIELKRIQSEIGITFLFVTHDQEEAMAMSDRLAVMNNGKIEQVGTPAEVYDHPATEFVASFLGASNLIPGTIVQRKADTVQVKLEDGALVTLPAAALQPGTGNDVKIGVRPEKFHVLAPAENAEPGWNMIEAKAGVSVYLGVSRQYMMESKTGRPLSVYAQNSGRSEDLAHGETVRLAWNPAHTFAVKAN
ncbi:ABC transporter ATP-binding protein [Acidocella aminolytica]|jgi:spermidine/putrescine transport system ATP-binding protein|uniref:Spermidine/putrescine import ATP-binding protein PotA n=1 Tax=Acidocella aminolytica 101 = DSM 11237 TaxID=1120923 RepID=A0A0D6PJ83_9PROT|nr:ABC transporter ATP-binding protein [Acidocella aminolytica]GAN81727.1 ABC transporter polyamine permease [Acidocella aminolytica 101 = DSM 11237]GBQ38298.1 nitrate/sulfonate/bicarbonate transporter ATP-binding protein [Acidocella aminolytica 101 = DSM 11237]SHF43955.1 spermidine/putrescine transport system ATP-binding protein [Acidocella aminolytica 101 = DSM 11237]